MTKCQPRALTPYLDRELSDDLRQEISEHLQSCPTCSALLDELSLASQQVRSMGRAEIPRSSLQPALEVFTERAGLERASTMTQARESEPTRGESQPAGDMPPVAPGHAEAPYVASAPNADLPTSSIYEWSDPPGGPTREAPVISPAAEPEASLGDEAVDVSADRHDALPQHPSPPPAQIRPPWMEAPAGEEEDLEEAGRRAVDEAIRAAEEPDRGGAAEHAPPPAGEAPSSDTASREIVPMEPETPLEAEPLLETEPLLEAEPKRVKESLGRIRADQADTATTAPRSPGGLGSLNTQLRVGLVSALVLIVIAAAILFTGRNSRQLPAASSRPTARQSAQSPAASPSQTNAPSPAVATPPALQLTGVVTAGSGGSGWRVLRVRQGRPVAGITRVVFDLQGGGPNPEARLGRGPDGAVYLMASGISISPTDLNGFAASGAITGVTQTAPGGLALRFATTGTPAFSISYLGSPTRLVLDFK